MKHYWTVIDSLMFYIEHGYDRENLKNALLQLDIELDRREVYNLPTDEIKSLREVLNRIMDKIASNE